MNFRKLIEDEILIFDGAMGTTLQRRGMPQGMLSEMMNFEMPEVVTGIHRDYLEAGAKVVITNSFQANELKLVDVTVEETAQAAVKCARAAGAKYVGFNCGPTGKVLVPAGDLSFERACEIYRRMALAGQAAGADYIHIGTMADLYETKAAIVAAKENTSLPVVCTMTFQENGRTFMGCDPKTAVFTLQGLGVDVLGVNCSVGPAQLFPVVEEMLRYSRVPVLVQPNAGLPVLRDGVTTYELPPEDFARVLAQMAGMGVSILGGCCGTGPEHIRALAERLKGQKPVAVSPLSVHACTSGRKTVIFGDAPVSIGGRLLAGEGDVCDLVDAAIDQMDDGVQVIRLGGASAAQLCEAVQAVQSALSLPLMIESADPQAIGAALRVYNGKAAVGVGTAEQGKLAEILAHVKKYGALILCLDGEKGAIGKLREAATRQGIPACDVATGEF